MLCVISLKDVFNYFYCMLHSRYLTWMDLFLINIDLTHPGGKELLKNGGFAVARSLIPGALSAVDKTMEQTFMKFAKSPGRNFFNSTFML